jgi:glycogen operon protein
VSHGVPMLLGGDEIGRSQGGNNNAYCQDNELSWFAWDLTDEQRDLRDYVARLIQLRREEPLLRLREYATADEDDRPQVCWFNEHGAEMAWTEWQEPDRRHVAMTIREAGFDHGILALINAGDVDVQFSMPSTIDQGNETVVRLLTSALGTNENDPVGRTPAGSLQLLRIEPLSES